MSTGRAILIGAIVAVVCIAVVAGLAVSGVFGSMLGDSSPADGPVLVALVLPNEAGILEPRVLDVYTPTASGWSVASVSPASPAVVSGTTGKTLADAYTFGGGKALARAYSGLGRGETKAWVIVDPSAWSTLSTGTALSVDLPASLEVFDGTRLVSFAAGRGSIPATQTAMLLNGAQYLSDTQDAAVRASVGDRLAEMLAAASASAQAGLRSDLRSGQLGGWLGTLKSRVRTSGS